MDGKHAARRRIPWPVLPVAAGLVVAAVAAGTVSVTLSGNESPQQGGVAAAAGTTNRHAMEHRASRGKPRSTATHSAPASPSTSSDSDDGDTQSAEVGQSGRCMAGYRGTGNVTASGAKFNPNIAAGGNRDLPFGTKVRITNVETGKSVEITINDRGPWQSNRCFDLTSSAYKQIASLADPEVQIDYEVLS